MILIVALYWFLVLREKHRLRVLGNRVLKRIFGYMSEAVAGG
jgi:hypothetical protein